jgi:hypothetical protein
MMYHEYLILILIIWKPMNWLEVSIVSYVSFPPQDEIKVLNEVPIVQKGLNMSSSNLIPPAPIYVEGVRWGAMVVDMLGI